MMPVALFLFGVILLAVACRLRTQQRILERPVERQWTGVAFDTSVIAPKIQAVRENYVAQLQARDYDDSFHQQLLACARETVCSVSFFKRKVNLPIFADESEN
jgi:hypothetical protein